jgi:hypothetical protein
MSPPPERIITRNKSLQRRYDGTTGLRFREKPSSTSPESPERDCLLALKCNSHLNERSHRTSLK